MKSKTEVIFEKLDALDDACEKGTVENVNYAADQLLIAAQIPRSDLRSHRYHQRMTASVIVSWTSFGEKYYLTHQNDRLWRLDTPKDSLKHLTTQNLANYFANNTAL